MSGGVTLSAPTVYGARGSAHTLDGTAIGEWVSDFEPDFEDDVIDFNGQDNRPTAQISDGFTWSFSATVANHPTPMALIEDLYFTRPKTTGTWVWTKPDGRVWTMVLEVQHITPNANSGSAMTVDIEGTVHSLTRA
jgi:hypothetical protein